MANNWNDLVVHASGRRMGSDFGWNPFHTIKSVINTAAGAAKKVDSTIEQVPVVGKGLHAIYDVGPAGLITTAADIAKGERIDKAVIGRFKNQIRDVKDVAPYAQTVVSFVPGIGQGVSGAIGAASALASGKPISEAMIVAVKESLPGGPLAAAALDAGIAAAQGKPITEIVIAGLPIPDDQKKMVHQGLNAVNDIAHGKRIDHVLVDNALKSLPPQYQKAISTGIALGHAKNLQDAMKTAVKGAVPQLAEIGLSKIAEDPVFKAGIHSLTDDAKNGFKIGAGMVNFKVNSTEFNAIRGRLTPHQKEGFDIAVSTHLGRLAKPLSQKIDPKARFGYYATLGMKNAKAENQVAMKKTLGTDNEISKGMHAARKHIEQQKDLKHATLWQRIVHIITGK